MITRGNADEDVMTFPPTCRSLYAEIKKTLAGFPGTIIPGHDAPFAGRNGDIPLFPAGHSNG
jgi:hypothetical protein